MNWIMENWETLLAAYGGFVVFASAIVKVTPTQKDDAILAKLLAFLDYFSTVDKK